jgi:NAD+ diphosphatase
MAEPDLLLSLPFFHTTMDRAAHLRTDEAYLRAALKDPESRMVEVCGATRVAVLDDSHLDWRPLESSDVEALTFLGLDESGSALFSIDIGDEEREGRTFAQLREIGVGLGDVDAAAALEAVALTSWHRRHQHCAVCGARTLIAEAGHTRTCPDCGADHYPRMDPAVIMLVTDGERCVLGQRVGAPGGRWSTLAGYVEPGESPEAAVVREVMEESGLVVTNVAYLGAQPWPFPSSLMLAYQADVAYQPLVLSSEHQAVRWFSREEIRAGLADGTIMIPGPISAGHHLIHRFID